MEAIIANAAIVLAYDVTKDMYRLWKANSLRGGLADIRLSMGNHAEAYREVETPNIVQNIAKKPVEFNESTNECHAKFFYTNSSMVIEQLKGCDPPYFAFDSIPNMFETLSTWNHVIATEKPNIKRSSTIYFLDPHLPSIRISHMNFGEYFQNVTIVNHDQAKQMLSISSVKIHRGCSVKFKHLTLSHDSVDVTDGGSAYLHKCNVGTSAPSLYVTSTTTSHDRQNDPGKVTFHQCTLSPPTVSKKWKVSLGRKNVDHQSNVIEGISRQILSRMDLRRHEHECGTAKKMPSTASTSYQCNPSATGSALPLSSSLSSSFDKSYAITNAAVVVAQPSPPESLDRWLLQNLPLFTNSEIQSFEIDLMGALIENLKFSAEEEIVTEGEYVDPALYLVRSGVLEAFTGAGYSRIMRSGSFFGGDMLLPDK